MMNSRIAVSRRGLVQGKAGFTLTDVYTLLEYFLSFKGKYILLSLRNHFAVYWFNIVLLSKQIPAPKGRDLLNPQSTRHSPETSGALPIGQALCPVRITIDRKPISLRPPWPFSYQVGHHSVDSSE
jgi:hypothetical protein